MQPILVTGANGFLGRQLVAELERQGLAWRAAQVGRIGPDTDWRAALSGTRIVIHCAGIAHADSPDPQELQRVNVLGTRRLAEQAAASGVQRLVFASSVKAMGEHTPAGESWTEQSPCAPQDAYGRSKLDAERSLREVEANSSLEVVVLRMPLLYGPGVRANLRRLLDAVRFGRPLPLGAVRNQRSLLAAANAAHALLHIARHPAARGRVFLAQDQTLSSAELARVLAEALGKRAHLWKIPPALLWLLPISRAALHRLTASLVVNDSLLRQEFGWTPAHDPRAEWLRTAQPTHPA